MRPKHDFRTASRDSYNDFCKKHPKIKLEFQQFLDIIYCWNNMFMNHILETGDKVKIPYGIGPLTVTKYKPNFYKKNGKGEEVRNLKIDFKASKEAGKTIYHLNRHTEGFRFYWAWFPNESYIKCPFIWQFNAARVHSRTLASLLKKPGNTAKDIYKVHINKY